MKICPVAIAVGCQKCPIVNACPAKSVIGDYVPRQDVNAKPGNEAEKGGGAPRS